jgi:hypothetical protein
MNYTHPRNSSATRNLFQPDVVVNFFDAHGPTSEDRAEIDFFASETDVATTG